MNSVSLMHFLFGFHFLFFCYICFSYSSIFSITSLLVLIFIFFGGGYFIKRKKEHEVWLVMKVGRIKERKSMIKLHYKETFK